MKKLTGEEIINTYINFFIEKGHTRIESSSLIPHDDPSILWINAGVTPLKKYFDGSVVPSNKRLVSVQKCIRTGDIESVGKTARHHTFFQMLGNFSIGDYFKKEALTWAFELLTSPKYFDIDKNKLYMTVYPTDKEAYEIWKSLGVDDSHIIKLEGNFWEIGEGPSGPDSEIFYDRGEKYDKEKLGINLLKNEIENDRYIEIWNNVFSQYNAKAGVKRENYDELPSKNIDTGMGVERMACILQDKPTNYETDLFMPIIEKLEEISHIPYNGKMEYKVIVDHIRALTFALADKATFENYGRGYVLRRILRRAVRMGRKLEINRSFLSELADVVIEKYGSIYPELIDNSNYIKTQITKEEELFQKTLISGEKRLEELFKTSLNNEITAEDAFKLYDTYGYPIELTMEACEEKGFTVDVLGFKKYMEAQKEMARANRKVENSMNLQNELLLNYKEESNFVGYDTLTVTTEIVSIFENNALVDTANDECYVVLRENPFYAESGGQVSDIGSLKNDFATVQVTDVIKAPNHQHLLKAKVLDGIIRKGDKVEASVFRERREAIMQNHSCVHLLQKTLQEFLGNNVHQAGSRVDEKTFRFDFTYHGRLSDLLLLQIEDRTNERINMKKDTVIEFLPLEEARKKGAMALFEDKYGDIVRTVTIADSIELCGGTHVKNTKDINKMAIISLENKGADTYRIEGATDINIEPMLQIAIKPYIIERDKLLSKAKKIIEEANNLDIKLTFDFKKNDYSLTSYKDIITVKDDLDVLKEQLKKLEKDYLREKSSKSIGNLSIFLATKEQINGIDVIITITKDYEISILKQIVDALANQLNNAFILIANVSGNNVNMICKSKSDKIDCGAIIKELAIKCHGNGGGNKSFAQGGGSDAHDIAIYLGEIKDKIKNM